MNSEHYGHETTQQNFFIHQNNRKLTPEDRQFVIDMMQGNASNPNMAAALSQRTGRIYSYQDVANLVKRISDEELVDPLEKKRKLLESEQKLPYSPRMNHFMIQVISAVCVSFA